MARIRIVVDSGADFPAPLTVERHKMTVVPHILQFGTEQYRDYHDMDAEEYFQRLSHDVPPPAIHAPSVEDYQAVYHQLARSTDKILSLHSSQTLSQSWENAKVASRDLLGRCDIAVIDSQTTSIGLGLLAEISAHIAQEVNTVEEAVRRVRGAIKRVYGIFYVDTLDYIQKTGLLSEAQSILGTMLSIKPFMTIEEGHLMAMEKVRTRSQAVDRLVEFVSEFLAVEKLIIMQNSPFMTEAVRMLQDRLSSELDERHFPTVLYGPLFASYIGLDATGVFVVEDENGIV